AIKYAFNAKRPISASANNELPPVNLCNELAISRLMAMWKRAGNRTVGVCRFLAVVVAACVLGLVGWVLGVVASGVIGRNFRLRFSIQVVMGRRWGTPGLS